MPPRLVHGRAVGQRRITAPDGLDWCSCSECISSNYVELSVASGLKGRYLTPRQKKEHIKEEKRKEYALEHLLSMLPPSNQGSTINVISQGDETPTVEVGVPLSDGYTSANSGGDDVTENEDDSEASQTRFRTTSKATLEHKSRREVRQERFSGPSHIVPSTSLLSDKSRKLQQISRSLDILASSAFLESLRANPLVFEVDPAQYPSSIDAIGQESADYELDPLHSTNFDFINLENSLYDSERYLEQEASRQAKPGYTPRVRKLLGLVRDKQTHATKMRRDSWMHQRQIFESESKRLVESAKYVSWSLRSMEPISCLIYILAATLHIVANLSFNDLGFVLPCLSILVKLALKESTNPESDRVINSIPSDVRTVITSLGIDPDYHSMVCCPSCFQTYKFNRQDPTSYPELCTYRSLRRGPACGRRLRNSAGPKREYVYQDLPQWIARMYARPEIEEFFGKVKRPSEAETGTPPAYAMEDIWDGSVLRNFIGPDGKHFLDKPENEGRLVFGLNMDGFNPYGNKEAGKHVSICGIYLVCFNLPPEIRYKPENIFLLGLVPGPDEPSTHEVNHVLRPLVDDLRFLWYTGIYLSRTPRYPVGRPVRCVLIPIICDLPAARRVAGLGGHASGTFCSECLLQLRDINDLDQTKWERRTYADHCAHAAAWRDAKSETEQTDIFQEYGAKWSELLRLPYWDPTMFVVIDPMHGFYLRMFHRHIRDIWGMNVEMEDGNGVPEISVSEDEISKAENILRHGSIAELQTLKRAQLQYLCRDARAHYGGRNGLLLKALLHHRVAQGWFQGNGDPVVMAQPTLRTVVTTAQSKAPAVAQALAPAHEPASLSPETTLDKQARLLYLYQTESKTALMKRDRTTLEELCVFKIGGEHADYIAQSKKNLVAKLLSVRASDGTVVARRHTKRTGTVLHLSGGPSMGPSPEGDASNGDAETQITDKVREDLLQVYQTGSKTKVNNLRKTMLTVLCAIKFRNGQFEAIAEYDALSKRRLLELVTEARLTDGIVDENGILIDEHSNRKNAVLGQATLKAIRDDMESISLPSWYSHAPRHSGEVKWGKFKAAEWKSFCIVNLPITLTRLWGSKSKEHPHYLMLNNFMQLVTAVKIASKRTITDDDIDLYEYHMKAYLSGLVKLYPHISLTPYQHLALHFPSHLRRFGPTHSWRCFAFERYNGLIQKLPSNNRFGEMEKSKFLRFCRLQNVRTLYSELRLPVELLEIIELFEKQYELKISGILEPSGVRVHDIGQRNPFAQLDTKQIRCFEHWMKMDDPTGKHHFIASSHKVYSYVARFAQRFEGGKSGNSQVVFLNNEGTESAGQISAIFSYTRLKDGVQAQEIFVLLREYRALSLNDIHNDVLRHLPPAVGFKVYNSLNDDLTLVPFVNIRSHFASLVLDEMPIPTLQVIPL